MADIASALARALVPAASAAVAEALADPAVPITRSSLPGAAGIPAALAGAVIAREIAPAAIQAVPQLQHLANAEPWYQSRVTVGNYIALIAPLLGPLLGRTFSADEQALATALITGIGVAVGAGISLWGRWFATKPIGT